MTNIADLKYVVIGGGISGLSAAWFLQQHGVSYTLVEQSERWGGKIRTDVIDIGEAQPFIVEAGPDSFIAQKPWATQLARAIDMDDDLIGTNDDHRKIFVLNRGKLTPLPDGLLLIVPTKFMPFALSPLISIPGKIRMALEPFLPSRTGDDDESLAEFVKRRLGAEILDKLAEPLMSGIYNTDPHDQSLLATFPRFRKLEQDYGSLTRGMLQARKANNHAPAPQSSSTPSSLFLSFKGGMESFVTRIVEKLNGDLRLNIGVESITRMDDQYHLTLTDSSTLKAHTIILTTSAPITANLLRPLAPETAAHIDSIRYVTTGTLSLAYRAIDVNLPPSFGVVIPRSENRAINAVTISSIKFDHRAPQGFVLMRVFFGGSRSPQTVELDDVALVHIVRDELRAIYGISAVPIFTRAYRWREATPQYAVGHLEKVNSIEQGLPPNIFVTGSAFRGVGVPDCVHQSQETVAKAVAKAVKP